MQRSKFLGSRWARPRRGGGPPRPPSLPPLPPPPRRESSTRMRAPANSYPSRRLIASSAAAAAAAAPARELHANARAGELVPVPALDRLVRVVRPLELDEGVRRRAAGRLQIDVHDPTALVEEIIDLALAHVDREVSHVHRACHG